MVFLLLLLSSFLHPIDVCIPTSTAAIPPLKLCPPHNLEADPITVPLPFIVTKCQITTVRTAEATVVTCPTGSILYDVSNPTTPVLVEPRYAPKCTFVSGVWSTNRKVYKCLITPTTFLPPDPCTQQLYPEKIRVYEDTICPDDWPVTYVVRAVDEAGNQITLDNDINNRKVVFDAARGPCGTWHFTNTGNSAYLRPTVYLKAFTCAVAGNTPCQCDMLEIAPTNGAVGEPVMEESSTICNPGKRLEFTYIQEDGTRYWDSASNLSGRRMQCMAGIWMLVGPPGRIYSVDGAQSSSKIF
ncbi:hypothetical protein PRIPAC_85025 [Pristionchus pacificus]|uniref:Uncharacterized protein n=1 Tax=Pristionchus pacificus TaxID=54126 RepID=A0A2A6BSD6_PRIPA|nr:hypothetical protein PRIPAC_85025 [Pristionchus pacificus]|eukprot:PDM68810.1 hypothetical protein PRIPAC_47112 [Pristionchus pacificus]